MLKTISTLKRASSQLSVSVRFINNTPKIYCNQTAINDNQQLNSDEEKYAPQLQLVSPDFKKYSSYIKKAVNKFFPNVKAGDIDLSSCDYLGLCWEDSLNKVDADSIRKQGRIHFNRSGTYPRDPNSSVHIFEQKIASFMGGESAVFVNSGTEANMAAMQAILQSRNIPIYLDKYAHATLALGARAAGRNDSIYFNHNDVDHLYKLIKEHGPGLVGVDSIYSAYGTICPLIEMTEICKKTGSIFLVDESHSLGVCGDMGEGLVKQLGLEKDIPYRTTSTGKSFAGGGGVLIMNEAAAEVAEYLRHGAVMSIFSLAPQEALADRMLATLEVVKKDNWRRIELRDKTEKFRNKCLDLGFSGTYMRGSTPIMAFVVGPLNVANDMYWEFIDKKIFPSPHVYPASPRNKSVVRFTICNTVSYEQIDFVGSVLEEMRKKYDPLSWPDAKGENLF